ncbi:MAG: hypothetical protein BGO69_19480 [Bacteroidetes bacterium 46-16]|nr:MAG: hypothetical protein BGO69_19480 [Bacteroidetes bacterium 46-16]
MCHIRAKHFFTLISFIFTGIAATAQTSSVSNPTSNRKNEPYSRYGIGELVNGNNTVIKGMGNISSAFSSPYQVNTDNPASYAGLLLTTYEGGMQGSLSTVTANQVSSRTGMATLSYLTIGFPLGKHAGMALGLRPQSHVYYHLNDTVGTPGIGQTINTYYGDGALNYAFAGFAGKVKGFSLGVNFGYSFGTIRNTSVFSNIDTTHAVNTDISQFTRVGGIYWKAGLQYEHKLDTNLSFRIGGTFTLSQDLRAFRDQYWLTYFNLGGSLQEDTAYTLTGTKGTLKLPMSYSIGAQLMNGDKWSAGLDFSAVQWSQFRNFGMVDSVTNSYRMGLGGAYTPNPLSIHNYLQRITYRLGAYYGKDHVYIKGTDINYYALTFGFSLPFKRYSDRIHTAFEIGKRGTEANGLVKENFFKMSLGISLNDKWFIKRRYD